jgi:hypothetical protein
MADDAELQALREELEKQTEEQRQRHQALMDHLATPAKPLTAAQQAAENRRLMTAGYAAGTSGEDAGGSDAGAGGDDA